MTWIDPWLALSLVLLAWYGIVKSLSLYGKWLRMIERRWEGKR